MSVTFLLFLLLLLIIIGLVYNSRHSAGTYTYFIHESKLDKDFKRTVSDILENSDWKRYHKVKEVEKLPANIDIKLVDRKMLNYTDDATYPNGDLVYYSETQYRGKDKHIHIDSKNWLHGVKESNLSVDDYRKYVINHEFGHALGYDHQTCSNGSCPVMYQATKGCYDGNVCKVQPTDIDLTNKLYL